MSLIVDNFGLFGMKKYPFKKSSFAGFIFSFMGVLIMLDLSNEINTIAILAIIMSFATGFTSVTSRSLNGKLSEHIGGMSSSLINHLVGLPLALIIALVIPTNNISLIFQNPVPEFWIYFGGLAGVMLVFIFNLTVMKIPSLRLSLLSFVGQIFIGILIDLLMHSDISKSSFYGGLIVAVGVILNMLTEYYQKNRKKKLESRH